MWLKKRPDFTNNPNLRRGRLRRRWSALLLTWLVGWVFRRRPPASSDAQARIDFPPQVRGRGYRLTEALRNLLRPRWLRMRREDEEGPP